MGMRKKNSPKNLRNETEEAEKENFFNSLYDKAFKGNTEATIALLAKSGRGYEISKADLDGILRNR